MVDAVLNLGLPAPIDVQVSGSNLEATLRDRHRSSPAQIRQLPGVSDVYIPQDIDYPALQLDIDRDARRRSSASTQREVVSNVITALTSNQMIAPSYWVDPKSGNDYMLTVQYPEPDSQPRRPPRHSAALGEVARSRRGSTPSPTSRRIKAPTEVDHYQLRRVDRHLRQPAERGSRPSRDGIDSIIADTELPTGVARRPARHGAGHAGVFRASASGLILAVVLLYLILVAQFRSFIDPFIILLAVPPD